MSKEKVEWIEVVGAQEHNLKNVSVSFPKNKITVVTGVSGSGKSSLVFETLFLESQRRFLDGLSHYSKNFVENFKKPKLEALKGVCPSIAIDQKTAGFSPRSTVGTMTEVLDYLRLWFARLGVAHCPTHGLPVAASSKEQILDWALSNLNGAKVRVLSPVAQGQKGEFTKEFVKWEGLGFLKAFVDGELIEIDKPLKLHKRKDHDIDLVVDQFLFKPELKERLTKALERSFSVVEDQIAFEVNGKREFFSLKASCPKCTYAVPTLEPRHLSFNNKQGACKKCKGLGTLDLIEEETEERVGSGGLSLSIKKKRYQNLSESLSVCPACGGSRLNERACNIFWEKGSLVDLTQLSLEDLHQKLSKAKFKNKKEKAVGTPLLKELTQRLQCLKDVGVGYLSLDRRSESLSGGERQRMRLATQLGNPLVGVLYVLDEPSIGLHPSDHHKLLKVVGSLKDQGNTIVIVEHDEDTMRISDHFIEIGPGAGRQGGEVVVQGEFKKVLEQKTKTTRYLKKENTITRSTKIKKTDKRPQLTLKGAFQNNLKIKKLSFPAQTLIGVSGVSGSGKSTLVMDTIAQNENLKQADFLGFDRFKKVSTVDQKPIGKTPRSTPITYVGVYQLIRNLFAALPESQVRGFKSGHFSFNSELGRCKECQGYGVKKISSHFLSDVAVSCLSCGGRRFSSEILEIKYKGKSISDVLNMSLDEALEFFSVHKAISKKIASLVDVGLGYIKLGQDSTTLSGGEAQRLKLSKELSKSFRGEVLYILDEPTTGLHFEDVQRLLNLLSSLVEKGHTVMAIEHQMDLLSQCDHLIDLGPGGGKHGGQVLDQGTPKELAKKALGPTGQALKKVFKNVSI